MNVNDIYNQRNEIYNDFDLQYIIDNERFWLNDWNKNNLFIFKYKDKIIGYNTASCMLIELRYNKNLDCYNIKRNIKPYRYRTTYAYNFIRNQKTGTIEDIVKYTYNYFDISYN
jgi:hypothetical protein